MDSTKTITLPVEWIETLLKYSRHCLDEQCNLKNEPITALLGYINSAELLLEHKELFQSGGDKTLNNKK